MEQYHIDVTPEEDSLFRDKPVKRNTNEQFKRKISFAKVLLVVLGIHGLVGGIIIASTNTTNAQKPEIDLTKPVEEIPKKYQQPTIPEANATPVPQPTVAPTPAPTPKSTNPKLTAVYIVKQGDTVYSIAKKYKLNVDRLIKLNNIKDVNKIVVGQKLKFM